METLDKRWAQRLQLPFYPKLMMTDAGILFGTGITLLPRTTPRAGDDEDRALALVAIAQRRPVQPQHLAHFQRSMVAWARGERVIAQFHLAYAQIAPLQNREDAKRLFLAEALLEAGFSPLWLAKEVNPPSNAVIQKYSPEEARNPAGSGDVSGRWTSGGAALDQNQDINAPGAIPVAYNGIYHDQLLDTIINDLRSKGSTVVKNVRITSYTGITAIADAVVLPAGAAIPYVMEVKTGFDPTFTNNQRYVYPLICLGGHAISADLRISQLNLVPGLPLLPLKVLVIYSPGEGKVFYDNACNYIVPIDKVWRAKL